MEAQRPRNQKSLPAPPAGAFSDSEVYRALLLGGDAEHVVERVLAALGRHVSFDWAGLIASGPEGAALVGSWEARGGEELRSSAEALTGARLAGELPRVPREGALPAEWGRPLTQRLAERGFRRVFHLPLGPQQAAGPGLLIASVSAAPFPERVRALLEDIALPLGGALEASGRERELERRVEERTRELSVLYDVSRRMGTTLGHQDLAHLVMGSLHSLLDFDIGATLLDLPGLHDLSLHAIRPASPECQADAAALARTAFREMSGRPVAEPPPAIRPLDDYEPEAAMLQGRLVSHLSAPLVRRGEVVGSLVVASRREDAFLESGRRLLQTLASQASLTLDRLRTLQEAEQGRVQSIIDSMPQGVLMADARFRVTFANPAARRTLELLAGQSLPGVLLEMGGIPMEQIARPVLEGGEAWTSTEIRIDDPRRIYSVSVSPIAGIIGGPTSGILIVITDITEAQMMQEQLQQSEKLSALGEMISGVAHELNNPLASVMGYAQLLQSARVREDVRRKLQVIYSESQRCQRVVQNLLSFARKHRPEKRLVDLNGALASVLSLLSYQLRVDGVEVRTSLDPAIPGVLGDFHLLQQVFLNIINNAHQAMRESDGGRALDVTSRLLTDTPPHAEEGTIRIEIRDTGPGISPENLKRIFDPFFTTKQVGQGTGLGLSLAYGAVREHKGQIYARSTLGKGTTFVIELPRAESPEPSVEQAVRAEPAPARAGRILVVDDEVMVARLLVEALSSKGHRVEAALGGAEALDRIRRRGYDVIISDFKMPQMDGRQLFEQVSAIKPELRRRIIFSTGDIASAPTRAFFEEQGVAFIAKPFDLREVHEKVGRLMGEAVP